MTQVKTILTQYTEKPGKAIPGYTGYVPQKNAETVYGGSFSAVIKECAGQRFPRGEKLNPGIQTGRSLSRPMHDPRGFMTQPTSVIGMPAGDVVEGRMPSSKQLKDPCNRPGFLDCRAIAGYQGYVPGKTSENVFGSTFTATVKRSHLAHDLGEYGKFNRPKPRSFWDKRYGGLSEKLTKEGTLVQGRENDCHQEMHLFSNSYNDFVRGGDVSHRDRGAAFPYKDVYTKASEDVHTGRQVLPAGLEKPFGRRDTFNRVVPPPPRQASKYCGFVPGKHSENIIGTREHTTHTLSKEFQRTNRLRNTNV